MASKHLPNGASTMSPCTLETGPLPLVWRGETSYEEARVGRVFNQRRPARYPVAVLEAKSVSDGK
jgi:hypothetical protein